MSAPEVKPRSWDFSVGWNYLMGIKNKFIVPVCLESIRLLPDSMVFGVVVLAFLSMSKSYGFLLLAMFEVMIGQRVIATLFSSISPIGAGPDSLHEICQPGFQYANLMRISMVETIGKPSAFPSPTILFVTSIVTYLIAAIREFSREVKVLGGDLPTRTAIGVVLSSCLVFTLFAFRYVYGCETLGTLLISMILGCVVGVVLVKQNMLLFGRGAVNILNLPMISTPQERGVPMYVCASSS